MEAISNKALLVSTLLQDTIQLCLEIETVLRHRKTYIKDHLLEPRSTLHLT